MTCYLEGHEVDGHGPLEDQDDEWTFVATTRTGTVNGPIRGVPEFLLGKRPARKRTAAAVRPRSRTWWRCVPATTCWCTKAGSASRTRHAARSRASRRKAGASAPLRQRDMAVPGDHQDQLGPGPRRFRCNVRLPVGRPAGGLRPGAHGLLLAARFGACMCATLRMTDKVGQLFSSPTLTNALRNDTPPLADSTKGVAVSSTPNCGVRGGQEPLVAAREGLRNALAGTNQTTASFFSSLLPQGRATRRCIGAKPGWARLGRSHEGSEGTGSRRAERSRSA